ncbi:hypothetical protein OTU49_011143, partial [Cherax quadricarinatus]
KLPNCVNVVLLLTNTAVEACLKVISFFFFVFLEHFFAVIKKDILFITFLINGPKFIEFCRLKIFPVLWAAAVWRSPCCGQLLCGEVRVVGSCCVVKSVLWAAAVWRSPCCGQLLCGEVRVVGSCCVAKSVLWAAAVWRSPCCGQLLCGEVRVVGSCCVVKSVLWAAASLQKCHHQQQHAKTMSAKIKVVIRS